VPLAIVLVSAALAPGSTWTVRALLAGFSLLAIIRPAAALLVTMALVGFGSILAILVGFPALRVSEVLVVASLVGCCVRAISDGAFRRALTEWISAPIVLLAMAAVASAVVWMRVHQVETEYPADFLRSLLAFVSRDYFVVAGDFWELVSTAVLLQGLALYVAVAALSRQDEAFIGGALRMLAVGGAGLGVMSVHRLAEIYLANPERIEQLRATSIGLRISPQIPDFIAAGSYFALCWLIVLGLAMDSPRRRVQWLAAGLPLIAALYLTGSRSVIAAALAGVIALVIILVRQKAYAIRGLLASAVVAVVIMVASYPWLTGRDVAGVMAKDSLVVRAELMRTGVSVIAARPLFGVGIDRFHLWSETLASPRLKALFPVRKNPHNDFLRVGAELGLVALGLFLWILAAAGGRIWRALQHSSDARLAGLVGGLIAFLTTSMVSNPLMVREVSFVFWIALGLAVGRSAGTLPPPVVNAHVTAGTSRLPGRFSKWRGRPLTALLIAGVLIVSIPFRARREVAAAVDGRNLTYGLFGWDTDTGGIRFRWSGPRATFFVDGHARLVEVPLKGVELPSGVPQQVELRVNGLLASRTNVRAEWQRLRTMLPPTPSSEPHRIDLAVSPTWVPAEISSSNEDRRVLGVRVGQIDVIMPPGVPRRP
jgi:O-antigen ligase